MIVKDLVGETKILRFPRTEKEEKNIQEAIEQTKRYFFDSSVSASIHSVAYFSSEYFKGIDCYVVINQSHCFPVQIVNQLEQGRNSLARGMEVVYVKSWFFPKELTERLIRKINYLIKSVK